MGKFVHLHVHSHYSLLDGLAKIDELLEEARSLGMDALALTDHGNMYGAIEFYRKALEMKIKPIIGCEVYVAPRSMLSKVPKIDTDPYHLVLLAKNYQGYLNLLQLVTKAHTQGYYYVPRIDKELLKKYHEGLIGLSACLGGEIPRLILAGNLEKATKAALNYQDILGPGNFYLELQFQDLADFKKVNEGLMKIAQKTKIPVVATNDVHYLKLEDQKAHEILLCIQTGKTLKDENRFSMREGNLSLLSPAEMIERFKALPEAYQNTLKIASLCNLDLKLGELYLPHFEVPSPYNENSYLRALCLKGLKRRYLLKSERPQSYPLKVERVKDEDLKKIKPQILKRLDDELLIIKKARFASYFLIVADFVNYAYSRGIMVGPGRGSVAGSLVAYLLGITNIDPLKYGLLFERFLNLERISPPDIDLDFADDRREEVIGYVAQKYGKDHIAQIVTFGTMLARNAVRDTGRALGMSYSEVDRIAKLIPMRMNLATALDQVPELKEIYNKEARVRRLLKMAQKLEGVVRHASTHAAGIVIAPKPLITYVPLQKSTRPGTEFTTQYSMYDLEAVGLLKMDLLGLANLTILANTVKIIEKVKGEKINLNKIPLDDAKTYQLLSEGETTGVFQLESKGYRKYLAKLKPNSFEDIIAMVALYRPGPMRWIDTFINRKHGREKITYLHPLLEKSLKETYGIPAYQEQIIQIAKDLANFSGPEADTLRKAMAKKITSWMRALRSKFIKGATKNKIDRKTAEEIFNFMEDFSAYAFNKSHSACYALIVYQTAYLKAHYPTEFMAALLTADHGDTDKIAQEINECQRMGIKVLPPSVNESFGNFTVSGEKQIRFGLEAIKNVGSGAIKAIITARQEGKFKSLEDFLFRVPAAEINKKVLESLIKVGALDEFGEREKMLAGIESMLKYATVAQKDTRMGQTDIFGLIGEDVMPPLKLPDVPSLPLLQKLAWEKELLGIYLSSHPLDNYVKHLKGKTIFCQDLCLDLVGREIKMGGIITNIQRATTRNSQAMLFVTLEDITGKIEILVFPKTLEKDPNFWQKDKIVLVEGTLSYKEGNFKLLCNDFQEINEDNLKTLELSDPAPFKNSKTASHNGGQIIIHLPTNGDKALLKKIYAALQAYKGQQEVFINIGGKKIKIPFKINFSAELKSLLQAIIGADAVRIIDKW